MDFNSLDELYLDVSKKCPSILEKMGEVAEDTLENTINEIIYEGGFQPKVYSRRYKNKGFADINNINMDFISSDTLEITNDTLANGSESGERLDNIIEYGQDYTWKRQPPPRPVFEITNEILNKSNILETVLEKELKKMGYELE